MRILNYDDGKESQGEGDLGVRDVVFTDAVLMTGILLMVFGVGGETAFRWGYGVFMILLILIETLFERSVGMWIYGYRIFLKEGGQAGVLRIGARTAIKYLAFILAAVSFVGQEIDAQILEKLFREEFFRRFMIAIFGMSLFANAWGFIGAMSGRRTIHDAVCGTRVVKCRGV